jgi:hypothetical protein
MLMKFFGRKLKFYGLLLRKIFSTMKYRRFTSQELQGLEPDFVRFLALNGIPGSDWVQLKADQSPKVDELIEQFSDALFERTLQELAFLEFHSPKDIKTFHCQKEKIVLVGLTLDGASESDVFTAENTAEILQKIQSGVITAKVYTAEKAYQNGDREAELFRMIENGALISKDGQLYKALAASLAHE